MAFPGVVWRGVVGGVTTRIVDVGPAGVPVPGRIVVEQQAQPDAMGGTRWEPMGTFTPDFLAGLLFDRGIIV